MSATELQLLEAKLLAATWASEIAAIAQQAPTAKAAVEELMTRYSLHVDQAVTIMDSPFRFVTADVRERLEAEIAVSKAAHPTE
ncbi:hypothetical protein [Actinoplanes friuliensis]|uniref:Uncharacterized protein n=1 Tax=Actinoplanes friuliensis DSM 7358 TaxID=1246995 RepID=U5VSZ8_9ACTN|nr:hypothetical protein [Actinoplanes friuliensis]AGZ40078.1 hypothetical protein AFR_08945 [Actinoplanes friuliensis DSM 7358]